MTERFKPKPVPVRETRDENGERVWFPESQYPDAIVIMGVPMVGDEIVVRIGPGEPRRAEVTGYDLQVRARPEGWEDAPSFVLGRCSPVPDEDEALVEEVAQAISSAHRRECGVGVSADATAVALADATAADRFVVMEEGEITADGVRVDHPYEVGRYVDGAWERWASCSGTYGAVRIAMALNEWAGTS